MAKKTVVTACALLGIILFVFAAASHPAPERPAGNANPDRPAARWVSDSKIACAFFFYWYDVHSGFHFKNPDGSDAMTDHPPDDTYSRYTYADPAWSRKELLDMLAARIDVVLPVYWGDEHSVIWSKTGLQNLVAAALQLSAEGIQPPRFGLFLDSASFQAQNGGSKPDLTRIDRLTMVYRMIKEYWTFIPKELWALVDGRPLVFFYTDEFVSGYNQRTFDILSNLFKRDFGMAPLLIKESTWEGVQTDGSYAWGVALNGPRTIGQIGSLGPGFDDRAVPNRPVKQYLDREAGDVYMAGWREIASSGVRIAAIETWNEWHEATDIAPSYEYGRHFVDMTAEGIRLWKEADFSRAPLVWTDLGRSPYVSGLRPALRVLDGSWRVCNRGNREGAYPDHNSHPPSSFIYFDVGNDFLYAAVREVWLTVEYYDRGSDGWFIQYDGQAGRYTKSATVKLTDSRKWKRKTFRFRDAYFGGRQNYGADFRIGDDFENDHRVNFFGRVWVSKTAHSNKPPALIRAADIEIIPHRLVEIPLITSDPEGQAVSLALDPPVRFARIVSKPEGAFVLELHPDEQDSRSRPYRVTVLATDSGTPALSDAMTVQVTVKF